MAPPTHCPPMALYSTILAPTALPFSHFWNLTEVTPRLPADSWLAGFSAARVTRAAMAENCT